jgi:hypothetical protein
MDITFLSCLCSMIHGMKQPFQVLHERERFFQPIEFSSLTFDFPGLTMHLEDHKLPSKFRQ